MTVLSWVVLGETGTSSKTMWAAITGAVSDGDKGWNFDVPCDTDDFSRCYKLYKECNLTKSDLQKVSTVFPWWKPFIDNWETLCTMYESRTPMFEYISGLENESRRINGWVETSPGHWRKQKKIEL